MNVFKDLFNRPYTLLVLAMVFWAGNAILGRAVRTEVPPIGLAFWRWGLGFVFVLPFALPHLKRDRATIQHHWPIILLLSGLGIAVFNTLLYIGLRSTSAINALLVQAVMPLIIVGLSFVWFGDRVTRRQLVAIALALLGAIAIITRGRWQTVLELSFNPGDLLVLVAVISYAAYSSLLRLRPVLHPLSFLATTFAMGTVMLLPFYGWEHNSHPMQLTPVTLLAVGYVSVFPSILSYICFNRGIELVGANRAGLFIYLIPVFGSLMAIALLGEALQSFHVIGISLIISGIVLFLTRRKVDESDGNYGPRRA